MIQKVAQNDAKFVATSSPFHKTTKVAQLWKKWPNLDLKIFRSDPSSGSRSDDDGRIRPLGSRLRPDEESAVQPTEASGADVIRLFSPLLTLAVSVSPRQV